jgi:hypothetical protein
MCVSVKQGDHPLGHDFLIDGHLLLHVGHLLHIVFNWIRSANFPSLQCELRLYLWDWLELQTDSPSTVPHRSCLYILLVYLPHLADCHGKAFASVRRQHRPVLLYRRFRAFFLIVSYACPLLLLPRPRRACKDSLAHSNFALWQG